MHVRPLQLVNILVSGPLPAENIKNFYRLVNIAIIMTEFAAHYMHAHTLLNIYPTYLDVALLSGTCYCC